MERIAMSQEERDKLEWLKRARDKRISQRKAASKIGVSDRWVRKLLKRMKKQGDRVVVHGLRGRTSNRKITAKVQVRALEMLQQPDWHAFGPTFASEQLAKWHGIELSDETLRRWMIQAGLWKSRARKLEQVHCWRPRRSAFGELVQWDTSEHDLVGRAWASALFGTAHRRRHQLELGPLCGARCHAAEHGCAVGVPGEKRAHGGRIHGSRFDVHGDVAHGRQ